MRQVLIVEDDFRVADINRRFVEQVEGFQVLSVCKTGRETLQFLDESTELPDLILLDIYIPDVEGSDLLWEIRKRYRQIDIIMLTAVKEVQMIEETIRGGIFDYIVKPIDFERFKQTMERYARQKDWLEQKSKQPMAELSQEDIDRLRQNTPNSNWPHSEQKEDLPKGIDPLTLERVKDSLAKEASRGVSYGTTAVEVSRSIGASRSTARRYLEYLVSTGDVQAEAIYGEVGRPERRYKLNV